MAEFMELGAGVKEWVGMADLDREFEFYNENKDELLSKYEGRVVVVKGEKILGDYSSEKEAIDATLKEHPLGTFLVRLVTREDDVAFFHSRVGI